MVRLPSSRIARLILLITLLMTGGVVTTMAQAGEATLAIAEVESQAFPRVTVFVAVANPQGLVEGLTAQSFQVTETGSALPAEAIQAEPGVLPNLRLVLALDVSGPPADLAEVQQAAQALIDTLGPQDRVAVIGFGDNVRLVRDFTNNTDELRTAVNSLTAGGSLTVLNRTIIEAVNLTEPLQMGRKGIIVITNRLDNSQPPVPIASALSQAQQLSTPIYVVGFGPDVPATSPLQAQLIPTGGQYLTVPTAQGVGGSLAEVGALLRQGYRVTFVSGIEADNAEHDFSISVSPQEGQTAQAGGRFEAVTGLVTVKISDLAAGQEVAGLINLTPQVTAPAAVASVEYLLDGQSLGVVSDRPYELEWDSATVEPGPHTLTVQALDSAGNIGQVAVEFIVGTPVQVSLTTPQSEVRVGDAVPLQANIQATNPLVRVDFLLDGVVVDSKTAPPYQFNLDSSRYTAGAHTITLRVEDSQGYIGESSLPLQFLPKPLPQPGWFEQLVNNPRVRLAAIVAVAVLTLSAIILIAFMLLKLIRKAQYRRSWKACQMELLNGGNIASRYHLQAKDSLGGLSFQFSLNGDKLPQYAPPQPVMATATGRMASRPVTPAAVPAASRNAAPSGATSSQPSVARQAWNKAEDAQSTATGCIYNIVSVLDSVASLLPSSLGSPIRRVSMQLSRGQMSVDYATRGPTQMVRTADYVRYQVAGAIPSKAKESWSGQASQTDTGPMEPVEVAPVTPASRPIQPELQPQSVHYPRSTEIWTETPVVEPTTTLLIDILIIPANPYQRQSYPFTMRSKPIEQEYAAPVTDQGVIDIPGISWFWRYIPVFMVVLISTLLIAGVIWLAVWRLMEMKLLETLALT